MCGDPSPTDQLFVALQRYVKSGLTTKTRHELIALLELDRVRRLTGPDASLEDIAAALKGELDDVVNAMWRDDVGADRTTFVAYHRDREALCHILDLGHSRLRPLEDRRKSAGGALEVSWNWFRKKDENRLLDDLARAMLRRAPERPPWLPAPESYVVHEKEREQLVERIIEASRDDKRVIIRVQGQPGIGKSALVLDCALDTQIREHFGLRRYLVPCEGVQSGPQLLSAIARALQVPQNELDYPGSKRAVRKELDPTPRRRPALLILDGVEAVLGSDELGVEDLLRDLVRHTADLALVCTSRDARETDGWNVLKLGPSSIESARALFNSRTYGKFAEDTKLDELLRELCGLPLAVKLICQPSLAHPSIESVITVWSESKTDMLDNEFAAALKLSIDGISDEARNLLRVVGPLPAGVAADTRLALLGDRHVHAVDGLCSASLATCEDKATARLHVHELIRDHVERHRLPPYKDLKRMFEHFCDLAIKWAPRPGRPDRAAAIERMRADSANIFWAVGAALDAQDRIGVYAAVELRHYAWFASVSIKHFEHHARKLAQDAPQLRGLLGSIGLSALSRSDHDEAERCFRTMLELCPDDADADRATAILNLGELDLRRFRHGDAAKKFDTALGMYSDGSQVGQGNCILGLGQVALRRRDFKTAKCCFDKAAVLYRDRDDLGELNCVKGRGDVAWRRGDFQAARAHFDEALTGYANLGHALACANCDRDLAELDLKRRDLDTARARLSRAEELYKRIENTLGTANCRAARAEIALQEGRLDEAREHVVAAADDFDKVGCEAGKRNCSARRKAIGRYLEGPTDALKLPTRKWVPDDNA